MQVTVKVLVGHHILLALVILTNIYHYYSLFLNLCTYNQCVCEVQLYSLAIYRVAINDMIWHHVYEYIFTVNSLGDYTNTDSYVAVVPRSNFKYSKATNENPSISWE